MYVFWVPWLEYELATDTFDTDSASAVFTTGKRENGLKKFYSCWSVCIDLSIRTATTKLGNQESFIDILMTDIAAHLLDVNERLNERLRNDRLDDQLDVRAK